MTRDTLVELVMGQLQQLLLRHSRDRELIGKLSEVFQSIQEEKYSEAAGKLNKTPVSRKVKADQGPEFNNATTLLQLLEQGLARRQVTPAAAELLQGPRAEVEEVRALLEKLRKKPRIDYRLRATVFPRASAGARLLLAGLAVPLLWVAFSIVRDTGGGLGYYLVSAALGLTGISMLIVAMVGEKKSVEKTLERM